MRNFISLCPPIRDGIGVARKLRVGFSPSYVSFNTHKVTSPRPFRLLSKSHPANRSSSFFSLSIARVRDILTG